MKTSRIDSKKLNSSMSINNINQTYTIQKKFGFKGNGSEAMSPSYRNNSKIGKGNLFGPDKKQPSVDISISISKPGQSRKAGFYST